MNSLLVSYTAWNAPKTFYISVNKEDLVGNASIREVICAWNNWPQSAAPDIHITDILPQQ